MRSFRNMAKVLRSYRVGTALSQLNLAEAIGYKSGQFISNCERAKCTLPTSCLLPCAKLLSEYTDIPVGLIYEALREAKIEDFADSLDKFSAISGYCA